MQEEPGETVSSDGKGVSVWLCPLCQQGQTDRNALAHHLTDRHSVLPACLEKLLDIAVPMQCSSGDDVEANSQSDTDYTSLQQEHLENTKSPSQPSQNEGESVNSLQIADCALILMGSGDKDDSSLEKETNEEVEGVRDQEDDVVRLESDQENVTQSSKTPGASVSNDKATGKNGVVAESDRNRPFKCNACMESFHTKTALSVHYNSATHVQMMRTGSVKQSGENDSSAPYLSRPYISNKPYQCAVCRVSYNHAITLESHLKSVLHQTRRRSAGNSTNNTATNSGNGNMVTNLVVTTGGNSAQLVTTSNCVTQTSLTASVATTKDREQIQPQSAPSLLSSPVASAQAVSAFLTLLTSSPNSLPHSILPSLFAAGASSGTAAPHLIHQPQMLMPLILNGLQNPSPNPESRSQLLPQSVPVLGLSAAQQALLAQRLRGLQSQWPTVGLPSTIQCGTEEIDKIAEKGVGVKKVKEEIKEESNEEQVPLKLKIKAEGMNKGCVQELNNALRSENRVQDGMVCRDKELEEDEEMGEKSTTKAESAEADTKTMAHSSVTNSPAAPVKNLDSPSSCVTEPSRCPNLNHKQAVNRTGLKLSAAKFGPLNATLALNPLVRTRPKTRPLLSPGPPILSEFQSQVLWAFLESRSEADAASPPREDCEALGREVGLTEDEVRRWLGFARHAKERQKARGADHSDSERDNDMEDEESALMIVETEGGQSPTATGSHVMDLSNSGERRREKELGMECQGDLCLTSDSENEEFYTSVIVTDEESQSSSMREEPASPVKEVAQGELTGEKSTGGGKVLRSTTVFLSDAEDEDDDEEGGAQRAKRKKRKRELDREEVDAKKERQDPDVDLQLEAQADPPTPLSVSVDHRGLPSGILHSLPLSLSLAPFSTQFISPYVLSLPSSVVGLGVAEGDGGKVPGFPNAPTITRCSAPFSDPLNAPPLSSHTQSTCFLSNGGDCEFALDLSIGKNHSSKTGFTSASAGDKASTQKGRLLDGLGLRPTAVGIPGEGGLIVVQVKPDSAIAIPTSNSTFVSCNNLAKTSTVYMRAAERVNTSRIEREKEKEREREKEREQKRPKARRFRDMRRSRTIIQAEQLDVLYGCYFKDPNPGKHEFEQISEWVHLPKKVVQIWFQNMRARERKGEVRFISDGTLAAVGKPLIKFTWPLTQPIFSSTPKPNTNSSSAVSTGVNPVHVHPKTEQVKEEKEILKIPSQGPSRPKEGASSSLVSSSVSLGPKTKLETVNTVTMVKIAPKALPPVIPVSMLGSSSPSSRPPQKCKPDEEGDEEEHTDEEDEHDQEKVGLGAANRMVPKLPTTPISKSAAMASQKHNGLSYWSPKGPFKINTLSREQLGLSAPRTPTTTTTIINSTPTIVSKPSQRDVSFLHHSTPRRPRTHLTCLQLSILQSCYETCAHPNALECEAVGTELGLPLKVVQIWFQNTRAKEKRWRLQQEKLSPNSTDPSKKVDISSGSYLQYNALRANRPILPKPVQLTVLEPPAPPAVGQPAGRETLRGRCEACSVGFESRAAARAHVFSPRHLATLRTTNFGQPASLVNNGSGNGSGTGSSSGSVVAGLSSSPSPASSTS